MATQSFCTSKPRIHSYLATVHPHAPRRKRAGSFPAGEQEEGSVERVGRIEGSVDLRERNTILGKKKGGEWLSYFKL